MHLSFIFLRFPLQFRVILLRTQGFIHAVLHVLHQHRQLTIFIILENHGVFKILVVFLLLLDERVPLFELLLNYFELLGICKGIFALDDFLQLRTESTAFIHVEFDFDFSLVGAGVFNVPLQQLDLILHLDQLSLLVSNLPFQICDQGAAVYL